jgi:hypothetical protein
MREVVIVVRGVRRKRQRNGVMQEEGGRDEEIL